MAITVKDVAKKAGISVSTVSNVLNGKINVGLQTRERVLRICEELHYVPNIAGRSLTGALTKSILFNFSDFDRSFYMKILEGVNEYARRCDYDLFICTTRSCEKFFHNNLTDGAIILDARMKTETLVRAACEKYPIVVMDRTLGGIEANSFIKSVVVNNYDPMTELVQGLVDRGCKKFAFLAGIENTDDTKERYAAFLDVLEKNKIVFKNEYYFSGDYRENSGSQAAKIMLLLPELPEALVCANDNMALGAIKTFLESGLQVPADIAVTGFDDSEFALSAGLTTVAIPNYERGYLAAQSLIENIEKKDADFCKIQHIQAKVQWRETTKKIVKDEK